MWERFMMGILEINMNSIEEDSAKCESCKWIELFMSKIKGIVYHLDFSIA